MEKKLSITYRNIYHTLFACFMMLLKKICIRCSGKLINFWFLHLKKNTHLAIQTFFGSVMLSSSYSHFSHIHVNLLPKGWRSFEMLDSFEWAVGRVEGSRCPGTPNRRGSKQHSLKEKSTNRGWMTVCFCCPGPFYTPPTLLPRHRLPPISTQEPHSSSSLMPKLTIAAG